GHGRRHPHQIEDQAQEVARPVSERSSLGGALPSAHSTFVLPKYHSGRTRVPWTESPLPARMGPPHKNIAGSEETNDEGALVVPGLPQDGRAGQAWSLLDLRLGRRGPC